MDESTDGFIYFTFGSMFRIETFPKHMLKAFYEAFNSIAPIRVLIKISDPVVLPENIPKNVKTLIWLPQTQILSKLFKYRHFYKDTQPFFKQQL